MKFSCQQCNAQYVLPDEKIGERGVQVRCKRCGYVNVVQKTATQRIADVLEDQPLVQLELSDSNPEGSSVEAMDSMFDAIFDPSDATTSTPKLSVDDEPTLDPSAVTREPELPRDWWVAIDNQQVGPLSRKELEGRIANGTVNRASLVWKTGMENWAPLEDVPELGTLIGRAATERELEKVAGADSAIPQGVHLGPAEKPEVDPIEWKPSAATQLSELVQAELKKEAPPVTHTAAGEVTNTASDLPAFHAPTGGSGFAQQERSNAWLPLLLVLLVASGVLYAQGFIQIGNGDSESVQALESASAAPLPETKPTVTESAPVPAKPPVDEAPADVAQEPETAPKPVEVTPAAKKEPVKKKLKRTKKTTKPKKKAKRPVSKKKVPQKSAGDDIDDIFDKAPALPARLPMKQVQAATKKNSTSLRSCIGSAIDNREVTPGRHTLELSFMILPNGRVQKPKMAGPYYLQGTSLPKCLGAAMRNWRYPKSREGNRVEKFPIPFNYKP